MVEDNDDCNYCFPSLDDCGFASSLYSPVLIVVWLFPHHYCLLFLDFSKHCSNLCSVSSVFVKVMKSD